MQPHDRLREAIFRCGNSGRPAIVAFVTAGYPRRELFRAQLADIAGEADAVEIGVPFTDPMADGLTIQRSSRKALEAGVRLPWILAELEAMNMPPAAPLLLMSYLNPLLAFGFEAFTQHAARVGISAVIVPDLPHEESEPLRAALDAQGIGLVQLVTPVTPPERLAMLCQASRGFVYAVTSAGTTGGGRGLPADVTTYLDRVRAVSPLPVCTGFGIRSADQVAALALHADGIVVGSALVEVLEAGGDPVAFLRSLRPACALT
ncbi:MAG: tryptophan synthase subunit alpha [Gammaproteobacteria bacterium]|nr:tryptophan synthase subunit alpha [Gammaproteobacteria bacterium]